MAETRPRIELQEWSFVHSPHVQRLRNMQYATDPDFFDVAKSWLERFPRI